jgi:hypothetical protein
MADHSEADFLEGLRRRGYLRLRQAAFRRNRATIWPLGQGGEVFMPARNLPRCT